MAFNEITSTGASVLFEWINKKLNFLSKITLYDNKLDDKCLPALKSLLCANTLDTLNLGQNSFSDAFVDMLYDIVGEKKDKCKLFHVDLLLNEHITEKSYPVALEIIKLSNIEVFQAVFGNQEFNGEFYASLALNMLKNGSALVECESA